MTRIAFPFLLFIASIVTAVFSQAAPRQWLPGDPHVHSRWSFDYDETTNPPTPRHDDAIYTLRRNAEMGRQFGLRWMVASDHGGPSHADVNRSKAYPELVESRQHVPEVLQFFGMELNMPGMDHHTVVVPAGPSEAEVLYQIEQGFDVNEPWPKEPARDTEAARTAAFKFMQNLAEPPLVFANHPARTAPGLGQWGLTSPAELRQNIDLAPGIYKGMEAAPGHQAKALDREGQATRKGARGSYGRKGAQTLGGYDQMVAVVGGVWDALLGEGRRFWITAGSDSHVHYSETKPEGDDFWPGEFQKTYVLANPTYEDVFDGLKEGRVFVSAGDLVTRLDVSAETAGQSVQAGGTLNVAAGADVRVIVRFDDPDSPNVGGTNPRVSRIDVIAGELRGPQAFPNGRNPTTRIVSRLPLNRLSRTGDRYEALITLPVTQSTYIRVRGTNSAESEPSMDRIGEGPWSDLWFYSNPIFVEVR